VLDHRGALGDEPANELRQPTLRVAPLSPLVNISCVNKIRHGQFRASKAYKKSAAIYLHDRNNTCVTPQVGEQTLGGDRGCLLTLRR